MTKKHKILFPIDFSEYSSQLVNDLLTMAKAFNSEIHLIYVARAFGYFSTIYVNTVAIQDLENAVITGAKRSLEEFKNLHLADHPQTVVSVLHGDAAEEIVRFAMVNDITMIIMGTHGRRAFEKLLMGSVTQRVVQSSPVPVLIINPLLRKENSGHR